MTAGTSSFSFGMHIGLLTAVGGYVGLVYWYYSSLQLLQERLRVADEKYGNITKLLAEPGNGSCQTLWRESSAAHAEGPADAGSEGFSFLAIFIAVGGCIVLTAFSYREYSFLQAKRLSSNHMSFTTSEMVSYRLDYHFSASKLAKPTLLFAVTFILILVSTIGFALVSGESFAAAMWRSWTYVADPGTHADAEGTATRIVALGATMGGMCVFALMIGIISDVIGEKVDDLKKGKSRIIESGHTLMLGWSDMSLSIIQQIALANESENGGIIAVLASNDKDEMEEALLAALSSPENPLDLLGTEVLFRHGNTLAEHDLSKVAAPYARAIIALSEGPDPDAADSRMVRQVLSLRGMFMRHAKEHGIAQEDMAHVVCELRDVDNRPLVEMVGAGLVEIVCSHDIIGRLMIQCARSTGLAFVLENLMGFDGDEFYLSEWPQVLGQRFGDLFYRFDDAVPLGLKKNGTLLLNPSDDVIVEEGDEVLVLAEDDDSYEANDGEFTVCVSGRLPPVAPRKNEPECILFCGWRRDMADMIKDLDLSVTPHSELWLLNSVPPTHRQALLLDKGNKEELALINLTIKHSMGNHYSKRDLKTIQAVSHENDNKLFHSDGTPLTKSLHEFNSILILAEQAGADGMEDGPADMESADSRSLASLLLVQDMLRHTQEAQQDSRTDASTGFEPISEILDTRTRALLADVEGVGYVLSNQIVSAAIAQIAECRDMNEVLGELLRAEGCELHLEPITNYLDPTSKELSFWEVYALARKRSHDTPDGPISEIALGYKPHDKNWTECADTILNPPNKRERRRWHAQDMLIVIAP